MIITFISVRSRQVSKRPGAGFWLCRAPGGDDVCLGSCNVQKITYLLTYLRMWQCPQRRSRSHAIHRIAVLKCSLERFSCRQVRAVFRVTCAFLHSSVA